MKVLLKFLDALEREMGGFFWMLVGLFGLTLSSLNDMNDSYLMQPNTQPRIEISSALRVPPGGRQESKRKKFDLVLHARLMKTFPDWEQRMGYQKKQEEFYKSAMRKKREIERVKNLDNTRYYTKEELNAINYFHGTGFFQEYQDPKLKPNIFDTRQTFLFKMHDDKLRNEFLNSLNRRNNKTI